MEAVRDIIDTYSHIFDETTRTYLASEGAFQPPRSGDLALLSADIPSELACHLDNMPCVCIAVVKHNCSSGTL